MENVKDYETAYVTVYHTVKEAAEWVESVTRDGWTVLSLSRYGAASKFPDGHMRWEYDALITRPHVMPDHILANSKSRQ